MSKKKQSQQPSVKTSAPAEKATPKSTPVVDWFEKATKWQLLGLLLGVLLLVSCLIFSDFVFQKKYYLFTDGGGDMFAQAYPDLIHLAHYFRTESLLPGWSFFVGFGQNTYPFSLDLTNLLTLANSPSAIAGGIIYVDLLMVLLSGFIFYWYLLSIPVSKFSAIVGAICYANGYIFIISGWSNHLMNEVLIVAMMLFGIERLLQHKQWYWLPLPFAWAGIIQPFYLFIFGLFAGIYTLVRCVELEYSPKNTIKSLFVLVGLAILGVGLSGFILGSNIYQLLDSPRGSGEVSSAQQLLSKPIFDLADSKQLYSALLRFFSNDLQGIGNEFLGHANYYEAPIHYSGWLLPLLLPLAFYGASVKQRIGRGILLAIFILPLFFPFFRYTFWAFTGDYYRGYSLVVGVVVLYSAIRGLDNLMKSNQSTVWWLIGSFVFVSLCLLLPDVQAAGINKSLRTLVLAGSFGYFLLLLILTKSGIANVAKVCMLLLMITEFSYSHSQSLKKRPTYSKQQLENRELLNDYSIDAINIIKAKDKSFYRIAEEASVTKNDPEAKLYYGTSAYHSFNSLNYIKFLQGVDLIQAGNEFQTRWIDGLYTQPVLGTLLSTKYLIVKTTNAELLRSMGFDSIGVANEYKIFVNRNYIPFGVSYDRFITLTDFKKLSANNKQVALLQAVVTDSTHIEMQQNLKQLSIAEFDTNKVFSYDLVKEYTRQLKQDTLNINSFSQNSISGTISLSKAKTLFFPMPYDKGWHLTVDNQATPLQKVQIGLTGVLLPAGKHTVMLTYKPPYQKAGGIVSLIFLVIYVALMFFFKRKKPAIVSA